MQLIDIEKAVLNLIGHTRYAKLSIATDPENAEDFLLLHRSVYLAREEIKLNTLIPSLLKRHPATTVANQKVYSMPADFDIPTKVRYRGSSFEYELDQVYPATLIEKLNGNLTTDTGDPAFYMIFGNSSDLVQMEIYLIPSTAGNYIDVEYKPVLENKIVSTDEDVIMKKYPNTVIKFATAFAFQLIKKAGAEFNKWYGMGMSDCSLIDQREVSADSNYQELPDANLRARRVSRYTI